MVIFFQSDCIRANWLFSMNDKVVVIRAKVVVFEKKWAVFRQSVCIWESWLYLGKSGCIRAKVVLFGQKCCCIRIKWLYSVKSCCILEKAVVFGQGGCIGTKWLY